MYDFPIALQLYSVRTDMEADFEGTLKKVKELGYDGVEFAGIFGKSAASNIISLLILHVALDISKRSSVERTLFHSVYWLVSDCLKHRIEHIVTVLSHKHAVTGLAVSTRSNE